MELGRGLCESTPPSTFWAMHIERLVGRTQTYLLGHVRDLEHELKRHGLRATRGTQDTKKF